jgi:beta-glucosidase
MSAFHLDAGFEPLYPFGFGLSYADFSYANISISESEVLAGESVTISVDLSNNSDRAAEEVVQLYVRDLVGNVTRPVRELKGFKRVLVEPGQTANVVFELNTDELAFFGRENRMILEAGDFHVWVGGDSRANLQAEFRMVEKQ